VSLLPYRSGQLVADAIASDTVGRSILVARLNMGAYGKYVDFVVVELGDEGCAIVENC
jgi:hypothetical protein